MRYTIINAMSDFSLGKSILSIREIVESASNIGAQQIALTDFMTVNGMPKFFTICEEFDIKPVMGVTLNVTDDPFLFPQPKQKIKQDFCWPRLYAKNEEGMRQIYDLLTKANSKEQAYKVARVGVDQVVDAMQSGNLVLSTGSDFSVFYRGMYVDMLKRVPQSHVILEAPAGSDPLSTQLRNDVEKFAVINCMVGQIVSTNQPKYKVGEHEALHTMRCIVTPRATKVSEWVPKSNQTNQTVSSSVTLTPTFDDFTFEWKPMKVSLPVMASDELGMLNNLIADGFKSRLEKSFQGHKPTDLQPYRERVDYEMGVIEKMGFVSYFLMIHDVVDFAKNAGIVVGPGRGSVGGSLVAFLIGITDVDPIRFGLFFERFTNPERKDLPDIDLDFQSSRRHEIFEYLSNKYGADKCAGITNYSMLGSASSLREVARMYGMHESQISCTKLIPKIHGTQHTLDEAAETVAEIAKFRDEHPAIWKEANLLQSRLRTLSQHAAGFVVSGVPLSERSVIENRKGDFPVTGWDKRSVESFGLVKMDILGLAMLDTLAIARGIIGPSAPVFTDLPLDDPKVLDAFSKGDTVGVFQFESGGMRRLLKNVGQSGDFTFMDAVACNALYRPGPMDSGLLDDYVAIRQGNKAPSYEHPDLEPILSKSHSVPIYQESIMEMVKVLAGFSGAEADDVRSAIGKKIVDKLKAMRSKFVEGAEDKLGKFGATEMWDKIEKYGSYSFNLSHAVEYTLISYYALYLKVHHPLAFYAAVLSIASKETSISLIARDMASKGIKLMPPSVKHSKPDLFYVDDNDAVYAPFKVIKQLTEKTGYEILKAKPFIQDFECPDSFRAALNESGAKVNKRQIDHLEKVGGFSSNALDEAFLLDQKALMPGLTVSNVKASRVMDLTSHSIDTIKTVINDYNTCSECELRENTHCAPTLSARSKIFVVLTGPTKSDGQKKRIGGGNVLEYLNSAAQSSGGEFDDLYVTGLIKAVRGDTAVNVDIVRACSKFLDREIEALNPPVIVALGRDAINHFVPDAKGAIADLAGNVYYDSKNDRSIVYGINPGMIYFNPDQQTVLDDCIAEAYRLIKR